MMERFRCSFCNEMVARAEKRDWLALHEGVLLQAVCRDCYNKLLERLFAANAANRELG